MTSTPGSSRRPLRILHVNKRYAPHIGGVETVVRQLAEGMAARGHTSTVLCMAERAFDATHNGVRVVALPIAAAIGSAPISSAFVSALKTLAREHDIVHFQFPNPMGEIAWLLTRRFIPGIRSVCTYQSDVLRPAALVPAYTVLARRFLKSCDAIVATSPQYRRTSPILSTLHREIRIIPLGIDSAPFERIPESARIRAEQLVSGLPHPRILFVGRLVYYKGVETLLEALALVPDASLVIAGDGPLRTSLASLARSLRVDGRVIFTGSLAEDVYPALFAAADIFVLPSTHRTEAFGIVGLEAMASGLPIVTTELGTATSFYNEHGTTGYVVPPGDVRTLAESLSALAGAVGLRSGMGRSARERVKDFSLSSMLDAYEALYVGMVTQQS
jgi:rhamnosyl/mannosyltransferase